MILINIHTIRVEIGARKIELMGCVCVIEQMNCSKYVAKCVADIWSCFSGSKHEKNDHVLFQQNNVSEDYQTGTGLQRRKACPCPVKYLMLYIP